MFYSYLNLNPFKTAVPLTAAFFEFVLCIILDMYLYFLKSIFHEIDFWTWFLQAMYTGSKNQVWNRQKIKFKNQFREIEIFKNQVEIDRRLETFLGKAPIIIDTLFQKRLITNSYPSY